MRNSLLLLLASLSMSGAWPARAAELEPMNGFSIDLGAVVGTAYFTVENDGYRIVATVALSEAGAPVRFVATLLSGQEVLLSVPRAVGESALEVTFKRLENRVFVTGNEAIASLAH